MARIGLLLLLSLASACAEVKPRETAAQLPGPAPGAPGPGIGGATSLAPPVFNQSRHN
jgi:hypothetical protein